MNAANIADALTALGEDDEAEKTYKEHFQFWPDLPDSSVGLARLAMYRRDSARARDQAEAALRAIPITATPARCARLCNCLQEILRRPKLIIASWPKMIARAAPLFYCAVSNLSVLAYLRFEAGDAPSGQTLANEAAANANKELSVSPKNHDTLYDLAGTEALLGHREETYSNLVAAVANGWIDYRSLALDPRFDSLRGDERFQTLIDQLSERMTLLRKKRALKD